MMNKHTLDQGAVIEPNPADKSGVVHERKPDQKAMVERICNDKNSTVTGNTRKKWMDAPKKWWADREARPKQQDAESGGNIMTIASPP